MSSGIPIVGPGAIGATIAACLHEAGRPLILCGRTPHSRLSVEPDGESPIVVPGPILTSPEDLSGPASIVLLAVKATQLEGVAGWLKALCTPETVVCVLQNGIEQVEMVTPLAGGARVVPAVVWIPAEPLGEGRVHLRGAPRLSLPDDPGGRAVASLLEGSRCSVEVTREFTTLAWSKLCGNAVSGLMVLTGRRAGIFRRPDLAALALAYLEECATVARADGANLPPHFAQERLARFQSMAADQGTSILFDREAGRELEWDIRNAVILRRAALHGIPAPLSETLVPLLAAASGSADTAPALVER